jgi:hypothetical protein
VSSTNICIYVCLDLIIEPSFIHSFIHFEDVMLEIDLALLK